PRHVVAVAHPGPSTRSRCTARAGRRLCGRGWRPSGANSARTSSPSTRWTTTNSRCAGVPPPSCRTASSNGSRRSPRRVMLSGDRSQSVLLLLVATYGRSRPPVSTRPRRTWAHRASIPSHRSVCAPRRGVDMGDIVRQGAVAFVAEVLARGGRAEPIPGQRDVRVRGADGSERVVRVCSTASDPWLARRRDGIPAADGGGVSHWVFVDLAPEVPAFYVVDADDIEGGIEEEVALWLADRPGRTPTGSHPIQRSNVVHGQDNWDLLGLDVVKDPRHDTTPVPAAAVRVERPAAPA